MYVFDQIEDTINVSEWYRPLKTMDLVSNPYGVWHQGSGLITVQSDVWNRRSDLKGAVLTAAVKQV